MEIERLKIWGNVTGLVLGPNGSKWICLSIIWNPVEGTTWQTTCFVCPDWAAPFQLHETKIISPNLKVFLSNLPIPIFVFSFGVKPRESTNTLEIQFSCSSSVIKAVPSTNDLTLGAYSRIGMFDPTSGILDFYLLSIVFPWFEARERNWPGEYSRTGRTGRMMDQNCPTSSFPDQLRAACYGSSLSTLGGIQGRHEAVLKNRWINQVSQARMGPWDRQNLWPYGLWS